MCVRAGSRGGNLVAHKRTVPIMANTCAVPQSSWIVKKKRNGKEFIYPAKLVFHRTLRHEVMV